MWTPSVLAVDARAIAPRRDRVRVKFTRGNNVLSPFAGPRLLFVAGPVLLAMQPEANLDAGEPIWRNWCGAAAC